MRPPMERTPAIGSAFARARELAGELGIDLAKGPPAAPVTATWSLPWASRSSTGWVPRVAARMRWTST